MTHVCYRYLLLALLLLTGSVQGAHITDRLVAGLYSKPDITSDPIRALTSGTPLDIIKRTKIFSKVRLGDNSQGWVENRYISTEKPARVMVLELQAKNSDLHKQLRALRREKIESATDIADDLKEALSSADAQTAALQEQLHQAQLRGDEAEAQIEALQQRLLAISGDDGKSFMAAFTGWHYLAILVLSLLAFVGGIFFKRHRISRRYGGFRI